MTDINRTNKTEESYLHRADLLIKRYEATTGNAFSGTGELFLQWLVESQPEISKATWRQYKSAVMHYCLVNGLHKLRTNLSEIGSDHCRPASAMAETGTRKTSAQKQKKISDEEFNAIQQVLLKEKVQYFWSIRTVLFLKATIITGLRPSEWPGASLLAALVDDTGHEIPSPFLRVVNAKNTNDRSHGKYRHLDLSGLSDPQFDTIKKQISFTRQPKGPGGLIEFDQYFEACEKCLYRTTKQLWPRRAKRPTLYSGRHQFSADLKQAGYSLLEIAALMGHATDDTASVHYGRKKAGRRGRKLVKALPQEVERIRQIYSQHASTKPVPKT